MPRLAMFCRRNSGELALTNCLAICQLEFYHALQSRCIMREALEESMTEWVLPARGEKLTVVLAVGSASSHVITSPVELSSLC